MIGGSPGVSFGEFHFVGGSLLFFGVLAWGVGYVRFA